MYIKHIEIHATAKLGTYNLNTHLLFWKKEGGIRINYIEELNKLKAKL